MAKNEQEIQKLMALGQTREEAYAAPQDEGKGRSTMQQLNARRGR
jgi:hypothetical protein